eukprot:jgi/Bigna1/70218/fgenesh1_pg.11_\
MTSPRPLVPPFFFEADADSGSGRKLKSLATLMQQCGNTSAQGIRSCTHLYNKLIRNPDVGPELLKRIQDTHEALFQLSSAFTHVFKIVGLRAASSARSSRGSNIETVDPKYLLCLMYDVIQACWACSSASWYSLLHVTYSGFKGATWISTVHGDFELIKLAYECYVMLRSTCENLRSVARDLTIECRRKKYALFVKKSPLPPKEEAKDRRQNPTLQYKKIVEGFEKQISALSKDASKLRAAGMETKAYIDDVQRVKSDGKSRRRMN